MLWLHLEPNCLSVRRKIRRRENFLIERNWKLCIFNRRSIYIGWRRSEHFLCCTMVILRRKNISFFYCCWTPPPKTQNRDGSAWSRLRPSGPNGIIRALAIYDSSYLIIGGSFTLVGTGAFNRIVKWPLNGSFYESVGNGLNGDINAICVTGKK